MSSHLSFIDAFWQDVIALIGILGVLLTALGVWISFRQIIKTTNAGKAATDAAIASLANSKARYDSYVVAQANRVLSDARLHLDRAEWNIAAIRLGDLADLLLQISEKTETWTGRANRLHEMEQSARKLIREQRELSSSQRRKWNSLDSEIRVGLSEILGPFKASDEDGNNDTR